jgi:hypothetical protein
MALLIANEIEEYVWGYKLDACHTPVNVNEHLIVGIRCRCAWHFFLLDLKILTVFVDLSVDLRGVGGETVYLSREICREGTRTYLFLLRPSLAYTTAIQTPFYIGQASALK